MDYILVFLINLLLMFHTAPETPVGSFLQGVSVAIIYTIIKEVILNKEHAKDSL